jgi:hypothetical protein
MYATVPSSAVKEPGQNGILQTYLFCLILLSCSRQIMCIHSAAMLRSRIIFMRLRWLRRLRYLFYYIASRYFVCFLHEQEITLKVRLFCLLIFFMIEIVLNVINISEKLLQFVKFQRKTLNVKL